MPTDILTADAFINRFAKVWKEFVEEGAMVDWCDENKWKKRMLDADDAFLKWLCEEFEGLAYCRKRPLKAAASAGEWQDLLAGPEFGNVDVAYVDEPHESLAGPAYGDFYYPVCCRALIEHEADGHIEQELAKLLYLVAPLKVIITYGFDFGPEESQRWFADKRAKLSEMLEKRRACMPEQDGIEYVLALGAKDGDAKAGDGGVVWQFFTYRSGGEDCAFVQRQP